MYAVFIITGAIARTDSQRGTEKVAKFSKR